MLVSSMSLDPVHSGLKVASDVRVKTSDTPRDKTPCEGSVNGVQCAFDVITEVGFGLAILIICRSSILKRHGPAVIFNKLVNGSIATSWSFGCRYEVVAREVRVDVVFNRCWIDAICLGEVRVCSRIKEMCRALLWRSARDWEGSRLETCGARKLVGRLPLPAMPEW